MQVRTPCGQLFCAAQAWLLGFIGVGQENLLDTLILEAQNVSFSCGFAVGFVCGPSGLHGKTKTSTPLLGSGQANQLAKDAEHYKKRHPEHPGPAKKVS